MTSSSKINSFKNVSLGKDINILHDIHLDKINISIYQRTIQHLDEEIIYFLNQDIQLKAQGTSKNIIETFKNHLSSKQLIHSHLLNDLSTLLKSFEETSKATHFRVLFSSIETDMCSRFHTDMNELRLLCTYYGPATLWLPEEGENRQAYDSGEHNQQIIKNPKLIQQANTGDVLILKGAIYPNAKAVIHRSPSIKKKGEKRLLLRIDMNKPLKSI
jgi:hypothetical protein